MNRPFLALACFVLISPSARAAELRPSGGDDSFLIQFAMEDARPGSPLVLTAGEYHVSQTIRLRPGRAISASGEAVLKWTGGKDFIFRVEGGTRGVSFSGLTFERGGIKIEDGRAVRIENCTFRHFSGDIEPIWFTGAEGLTVRNCVFTDVQTDGAIIGWNCREGDFSYNRLDDVNEGFHFFWGGRRRGPDNVSITHNSFSRVKHFALEQQGNPSHLDIACNYADDWVPQPSQMGFSIATGGDHGGINENPQDTAYQVHIHDNVIGGNHLRSSEEDKFAAVEAMGADIEIDHNFIAGSWDASVIYTLTTPKWSFHDNTLVGIRRHPPLGLSADNPTDKAVAPDPANVHDNKVAAEGEMAMPKTDPSRK